MGSLACDVWSRQSGHPLVMILHKTFHFVCFKLQVSVRVKNSAVCRGWEMGGVARHYTILCMCIVVVFFFFFLSPLAFR